MVDTRRSTPLQCCAQLQHLDINISWCLAASGRKMVSKLCNISFSLAGSTARSTCNWMGCPGPAAWAPGALVAAASIVFKQVRRFIFSPLAHRRSLIKLLLAPYGELDPVQAGACAGVG